MPGIREEVSGMDEKKIRPAGPGGKIVRVTVEAAGVATTRMLQLTPDGERGLEWLLDLLGAWNAEESE